MRTPAPVPAHPAPHENWYADEPFLADLVRSYLDKKLYGEADKRLERLGEVAAQEVDALARLADRHRPILHRRAPTGERWDEVEFHPSYFELQRIAREHDVFTLAWHPFGSAERGPRVLGFALGYLYAQAESGYYCPACMTDGAAFVLDRHAPRGLAAAFVPRLVSRNVEEGYEGAMYLTERGGGSDVGGGTATMAEPHSDGTWRLTGEKWFASNCVADVALALARMPSDEPGTRGLGLFLVPRELDDGSPNPGLFIERLKEKLGVTSMPTGEVVLDEAVAYLVAGEGEGFKRMAEMVNLSRLYNAVASVAIARRSVREGQRVGAHRSSFGRPVREHPLFLRALTRLSVEVEGALAFTLDTADTFDRAAAGDEEAYRVLRILTPCAKAATAKLAVRAASEACEFLGGAGYIEEYVTPRLLRDAQVLPIWEGTTNIQALDLLRAIVRDDAIAPFIAHVQLSLDQGATVPDVGKAVARARAAIERFELDLDALASEGDEAVEAGALRLLMRAYHLHATALLVRAAAHAQDAERAATVADLYAAILLDPDKDVGERALELEVVEGDGRVAYPLG